MSGRRGMALIVLAAVLALTLPSVWAWAADGEAKRVETLIEELGGRVEARTGEDGRPVVRVTTDSSWRGGDEGLALLARLDHLEKLRLGPHVGDSALPHVAALTGLRSLDLHAPEVTDAGLVHLAQLEKLERLNLTYTGVTDAGLVHLAGLSHLRWLGLVHTAVTEAGVEDLRRALPGLKVDGVAADPPAAAPAAPARYLYQWGSHGARKGQFDRPAGIAVYRGTRGRPELVIADSGNHRIRNYTHDGMFIDKWGSHGTGDGQLDTPLGVAVDARGELWIADSGNGRLSRTAVSSQTLRDAPGAWLGERGGFGAPVDVEPGPEGTLYVLDRRPPQLYRLAADGEQVGAWTIDGLAAPAGVAAGPDGRLYVTDADGHRVLVVDGDGAVVAVWGSRGAGPGQLDGPRGIAVGPDGRVWVADQGNDRVQVFDSEGRPLGSVGGPGQGDGELRHPYGVAVDEHRLYVTDGDNHRIQVYEVLGT